jgi:hypothetical protein
VEKIHNTFRKKLVDFKGDSQAYADYQEEKETYIHLLTKLRRGDRIDVQYKSKDELLKDVTFAWVGEEEVRRGYHGNGMLIKYEYYIDQKQNF